MIPPSHVHLSCQRYPHVKPFLHSCSHKPDGSLLSRIVSWDVPSGNRELYDSVSSMWTGSFRAGGMIQSFIKVFSQPASRRSFLTELPLTSIYCTVPLALPEVHSMMDKRLPPLRLVDSIALQTFAQLRTVNQATCGQLPRQREHFTSVDHFPTVFSRESPPPTHSEAEVPDGLLRGSRA